MLICSYCRFSYGRVHPRPRRHHSGTYPACRAHRCSSWTAAPAPHSPFPRSSALGLCTPSGASGCTPCHRWTTCSRTSTCHPLRQRKDTTCYGVHKSETKLEQCTSRHKLACNSWPFLARQIDRQSDLLKKSQSALLKVLFLACWCTFTLPLLSLCAGPISALSSPFYKLVSSLSVLNVYKKMSDKSGICGLGGGFFAFFNKEVKVKEVKLGQKFFLSRKIFDVKYFLLKDIARGTELFHMSRIGNVFSTFQNPTNDFQKH